MSCNCNNNDPNCDSCFGGINIPVGPIGPKGDQGDQGPTGPTGATGPQGDQGDQGDTGADSTVQGPQGDPGATGPAGPKGQVGERGVQGLQGLPGAVGAVGPQGIQGIAGAAGINSTIFDTYISDLALAHQLVLLETLIPGMTTVVGSGTGNYIVFYELFMSTNPAVSIILKVDGVAVETLNVGVLSPSDKNVSNFWIGNVDDGKSIQVFGIGTDGFDEEVGGFKFGVIRLG